MQETGFLCSFFNIQFQVRSSGLNLALGFRKRVLSKVQKIKSFSWVGSKSKRHLDCFWIIKSCIHIFTEEEIYISCKNCISRGWGMRMTLVIPMTRSRPRPGVSVFILRLRLWIARGESSQQSDTGTPSTPGTRLSGQPGTRWHYRTR